MPLYEYQCPQGHVVTEYRKIAERLEPATCGCGQLAQRAIITPPRVFGDFEGYESPATGRWVEGRRARIEDLKRSGCRPYEAGEREEAARRAELNERQLDRSVDLAVDSALHELTI